MECQKDVQWLPRTTVKYVLHILHSTFFNKSVFNLQQQNFVAWQCLRDVGIVIRATTLFNLQPNLTPVKGPNHAFNHEVKPWSANCSCVCPNDYAYRRHFTRRSPTCRKSGYIYIDHFINTTMHHWSLYTHSIAFILFEFYSI